jgi:hypothetical protein
MIGPPGDVLAHSQVREIGPTLLLPSQWRPHGKPRPCAAGDQRTPRAIWSCWLWYRRRSCPADGRRAGSLGEKRGQFSGGTGLSDGDGGVCLRGSFEGFLRKAREIDRIGRGSTATHALRRLLRQTRSLQNHCSSPSDREWPAGCADVNRVRHAEQAHAILHRARHVENQELCPLSY